MSRSINNNLSSVSDFLLKQVGLKKGPTNFAFLWNHCITYKFQAERIYSFYTLSYFGTPGDNKKPPYLPTETVDILAIELLFADFPTTALKYIGLEYRIDFAQLKTRGSDGTYLHIYGRSKNRDGNWGIGRKNILMLSMNDDLDWVT